MRASQPRNPADLVERLSPTGDAPAIPEQIPAGPPSDLVRRRPDTRQAEAQLHGATTEIGEAKAQISPGFLSPAVQVGPAVRVLQHPPLAALQGGQ
jgi:hypothetical protein